MFPVFIKREKNGNFIFLLMGHNSCSPLGVKKSNIKCVRTPMPINGFIIEHIKQNNKLCVKPLCFNITLIGFAKCPNFEPLWSISGKREPKPINIASGVLVPSSNAVVTPAIK